MANKFYVDYKNDCKSRGIKIVKDRFDSKDENLKKELEMLEESENMTFGEMMAGRWGSLFIRVLLPIAVVIGLFLIYV